MYNYTGVNHYSSLTSHNLRKTMELLGLNMSENPNRIDFNGGTIPLNILFNIQYFSLSSSSSDIYTNSFPSIPFGKKIHTKEEISPEENIFKNQNKLLTAIWGKGLFSQLPFRQEKKDKYQTFIGFPSFTDDQYVSLFIKKPTKFSSKKTLSIFKNGELIYSLPRPNEEGKAIRYQIFPIGITDKDTNLEIKTSIPITDDLKVYGIKKEELLQLIQFLKNNNQDSRFEISPQKLKATVYNSDDQYLFLPITYDKGWNAQINNTSVKPERIFNTFIALKLQKGINRIKMIFIPHGFIMGIIISISGLLILLLSFFLPTQRKEFS